MPLCGDVLDAVAEAVDWDANPYPQTHPKHCEFQRNQRATAIERLGLDAAKRMRLSDFAAEEYHHDVAAAHRMASEKKRRGHHGDGASISSQASTPRRLAGGMANGIPPIRMMPGVGGPGSGRGGAHLENKVLSSTSGFHLPLPMRVQVAHNGAAAVDGDPASTAAAAVTCSATLYGGQYVFYGCDDGTLYVRQRTTGDQIIHGAHLSEHTRCDALVDARTTQRAAEEGLMGTPALCASGVWVSRRFHRAVCRSVAADDGGSRQRHRRASIVPFPSGCDAKSPYATTMCATHDGAYVAIGVSDGTLHVWNSATMESIALLEAPCSTADGRAPAAAAVEDGDRRPPPQVVQLRPLRGVDTTTAAVPNDPGSKKGSDDDGMSATARQSEGLMGPDAEVRIPCPLKRYEFIVLYADGTLARVAFAVAAEASGASGAVDDSAKPHYHLNAMSFVLQRPRLIKGTCVPMSLCLTTDESCIYVSNEEGQFMAVDVVDLHVATRCHITELLARAQSQQYVNQPVSQPSSLSTGANGDARGTAPTSVIAVQLATSNAYVTAMDAFEAYIAIGLSTGEAVLLKRMQGTLSRSIFAVLCHHKCLAQHYIAAEGPRRQAPVSATKISASSMEVFALLGSSEIVVWSMTSDLSYSIVRRSVLPPVETYVDNDGAKKGRGPVELVLHTHVDAMEVWSAGADGLNYIWMSEFQRTSSEIGEAHAACVAVAQSNGLSLVDGHITISRCGAASERAVATATEALQRTSEASVYRRYFWSWIQYRLQHQLQRKQQGFAAMLSRHVVALRGRNYFQRWAAFRNERVRLKQLAHAASALATAKRHQMLLGAVIVWGRFATKQRQTRTLHKRAVLLQEAIERRNRHVAFQRLRNYVRVQRLDRRWGALANCLAQASDRSTMRRAWMSWWTFNVARKEGTFRAHIATQLANVSAIPSLAATAWCTWRQVCDQHRRTAVLQQWSRELAAYGDPQRAKAWLMKWVGVVYARRRAVHEAAVRALEQREATLKSSITVAAPRAQRFHRLSALTQRLATLQERMRDLGDVQAIIATRVASVRATQMAAVASDGRSCSPLCLQVVGGEARPVFPRGGGHITGTQTQGATGAVAEARIEEVQDDTERVFLQFPNVMMRLKGSLLNPATDGQWLHTSVDRCRSVGAPKQFLHTVHLLEKHTRALFAPPATFVAVDSNAVDAGAAQALDGTRRSSIDSSTGRSDPTLVGLWVPDDVTEADLRTAVVALVDTDPHAAQTLLRCLATIVIAFDCMTPSERRSAVSEAVQESIVHHEEFLGILHDALTRSGIVTA